MRRSDGLRAHYRGRTTYVVWSGRRALRQAPRQRPAECGRSTRRSRAARRGGVLRPQLRALLAELVEGEVDAQHRDVEGHQPGEHRGDYDDPDDPACKPPLGSARRRLGPGLREPRPGWPCPCDRSGGRHQTFSATRSRADAERGLSAISRASGRTARRQHAKHGVPTARADREVGRTDAPARLGPEEALHDPVLERVEADDGDPASRRSSRTAAGSASSSWPSSSLTAMRNAWKARLAGWPSPKRAGVGMAFLITSTSSPVRANGSLRRRRTMARAIWRA